MPLTCSDIPKLILALILPPLGVLAEKGCGKDLIINILLTCLFWIPGMIHAICVIFYYWPLYPCMSSPVEIRQGHSCQRNLKASHDNGTSRPHQSHSTLPSICKLFIISSIPCVSVRWFTSFVFLFHTYICYNISVLYICNQSWP